MAERAASKIVRHIASLFANERAILERQVDHLVRLVDDLLNISRITVGKVELRKARFDLRDAINTSLEAASPEFDRLHHHVRAGIGEQPLWVYGDAARVAQVVQLTELTELLGKSWLESR